MQKKDAKSIWLIKDVEHSGREITYRADGNELAAAAAALFYEKDSAPKLRANASLDDVHRYLTHDLQYSTRRRVLANGRLGKEIRVGGSW